MFILPTYSVNHPRESVATLGNDVDNASSVVAHVAIKSSLAHIERSIEVQVHDSGKALGSQHACRRHELPSSVVLINQEREMREESGHGSNMTKHAEIQGQKTGHIQPGR